MKKTRKDNKNPHWLWLYALAVLLLAIVVNMAMYLPIPTLGTLRSNDWLGFWGGYLGGVLGCIPAFAALAESRRQSKQQHEENQTDRRLQVMPVFNCHIFTASYGYRSKLNTSGYFVLDSNFLLREPDYDEFPEKEQHENTNYMEICNCGLGPAIEVKLSCNGNPVNLFHFKDKDTRHYLLDPSWKLLHKSKVTSSPATLEFNFTYIDILGNEYTQTHTFPLMILMLLSSTHPKIEF